MLLGKPSTSRLAAVYLKEQPPTHPKLPVKWSLPAKGYLGKILLMSGRLWDFFVDTMITLFLPLVCSYFTLTTSIFFNVSAQNGTGLEWAGNALLAPVQYLLAGKEAIEKPDGSWEFVQRFDYKNAFWIKTASSVIALPPSFLLGSAVKGLSFVDKKARGHYAAIQAAMSSQKTHSHLAYYQEMGLQVGKAMETLLPQGHERRPGDEQVLAIEKEALREITALLNGANIPWWVDCGTCLGAYRYGGVIPWDSDVDIAVLLPDFENVRHALNQLDPSKYIVQDWSSREHPDSYLKVYIRKSNSLIDIYHFAIHPETKQLCYILSLETNMFFPEWWKVRERRFTVPVAFDTVFPLKRGTLDGVEVFVPNDTKKYLQRYYGENLDPVKIYDTATGQYEKDLSHPYWQKVYAK